MPEENSSDRGTSNNDFVGPERPVPPTDYPRLWENLEMEILDSLQRQLRGISESVSSYGWISQLTEATQSAFRGGEDSTVIAGLEAVYNEATRYGDTIIKQVISMEEAHLSARNVLEEKSEQVARSARSLAQEAQALAADAAKNSIFNA